MEDIWFDRENDTVFNVRLGEDLIAILVCTGTWKLKTFDCYERLFEERELVAIAGKLEELNT